ncbi:hypothetical protein ACOMHN_005749 [Nucella lapillus]
MAASDHNNKRERTDTKSSQLGMSGDAQFRDPLLSVLEKDDEDEGIESLTTESASATESEVRESHTSSTLSNLPSEGDEDSETRDVFVKVDNPEKHTSAMESYITFRVSTKTTRAEFGCSEYTVRRRFSEFLWLRHQLEDSYPMYLIPPLPQKHSLMRLDHFSLDFVRMRQKALQKFLSRLSDHPILSFDKNFYVFLTTNASEFQLHRKQGKGIISQVTDSVHSLGASYMMKNRPVEFSLMHEYVSVFGDKMGVMDRVASRALKEQTDYHSELCGWAPCYTLWANSEDQLRAPLLSLTKAIDQCATQLKDLIDGTDDSISQPLKEYVLYAECIKAVLRKRDAVQMEYDRVLDELNRRKDEREQLKISDQTYSLGAFFGKDPCEVKHQKEEKAAQQIAELTKRKEVLNDKTEVADADLKADMDRWHQTKMGDVKHILTSMADRQIHCYEQCLTVWQDAIRAIQKKDDNDDESYESAAVVEDDLFSLATARGRSSAAKTSGGATAAAAAAATPPVGSPPATTDVSPPGEGGGVCCGVESKSAGDASVTVS